ncbi:hypothetical protein ABIJ78_004597 [Salmonella enterica]
MNTGNEASYIDKNGRWVKPLVIGLIAFLAPFTFVLAGIQPPSYVSFSFIIAAIAFLIAGLGAVFTDTFSAVVARVLIIGTTSGVSLFYLLNHYGWN